jgi:hypothetical protein
MAVIKYLLTIDILPNDYGLGSAIAMGYLDLVKFLLELGVVPNKESGSCTEWQY